MNTRGCCDRDKFLGFRERVGRAQGKKIVFKMVFKMVGNMPFISHTYSQSSEWNLSKLCKIIKLTD